MEYSVYLEVNVKHKSLFFNEINGILSILGIKREPLIIFEYTIIINGKSFSYSTELKNKVEDKHQFYLLSKRIDNAKSISLIKDEDLKDKINGILIDESFYYPFFADFAHFTLTRHQLELLEKYSVSQETHSYSENEKKNLNTLFELKYKNGRLKKVMPIVGLSGSIIGDLIRSIVLYSLFLVVSLGVYCIIQSFIYRQIVLPTLEPVKTVSFYIIFVVVSKIIESFLNKRAYQKIKSGDIAVGYFPREFRVEYLNYYDFNAPLIEYKDRNKIIEYSVCSNELLPAKVVLNKNIKDIIE